MRALLSSDEIVRLKHKEKSQVVDEQQTVLDKIAISPHPKFKRLKILPFTPVLHLSPNFIQLLLSASSTILSLRMDQRGQSLCLSVVYSVLHQATFPALHGRNAHTAALNTRQGPERKG